MQNLISISSCLSEKNKGQTYHLRVRSDVEGKDSGCQGTEELWAVPHWCKVGHVVVKVSKELHECYWVLPEPGTFLL